jgi:hypothetical protein
MMAKGLGLAPQTQGAQLAPAQTVGSVGDNMQAYQQLILDDMVNKYYQNQQFPLGVGKELMGVVGGMPGGTNVSTGSVPDTNPLSSILGLGMMGASLFGGPATASMFAGNQGLGSLLAFL